jgi:putative transposase
VSEGGFGVVCDSVRDGQMVLRWTAAGMLNAERSFRRIKGYKQMPQLVKALRRHAHPETVSDTEPVGAAT